MKKTIPFLLLILTLNCEEIINEQNISNDTITVLAPTENTVLPTGQKITYSWETLNGANSYRLQIARPTFSNANQLVLDTLVTTTRFTLDSLIENNYQWRVKGLNTAFESNYTTVTFTVEP